jgi:flagellar biosynthesis protein FlhF
MRLKLYRAPDAREAMTRIRAELGTDALILGTRRVSDGVEITAAINRESLPEPPPHDPERERLLAWHGVPAAQAASLQAGTLDAALARVLCFTATPVGENAAPLLLVGPPGAGKTLTVARLATRLVMAGATPLVITADGRRAGATEQLAAFTRLLGLSLIVASHPVTLARALARRQQGAPVLIDAPGVDPFDTVQRDEIGALAASATATTALVLPAGIDPAEATDLAGAFAEQGASLLIATRLDMSRRLGGVLAAAQSGGLALTEAGIGPGAADGLAPMTAALLAERLVRGGGVQARALLAALCA